MMANDNVRSVGGPMDAEMHPRFRLEDLGLKTCTKAACS